MWAVSNKGIDAVKLDAIELLLRNSAELRRMMTYGELMYAVKGITRFNIGDYLTALAKKDRAAGRPLLSCLVVNTEKHIPSDGFWDKTIKQVLGKAVEKRNRFPYWREMRGAVYGWYACRSALLAV